VTPAAAPRGSRPRVLFVVNDAGFFLSHRLVLAQAAAARGYDVQVATPASDAVSRIHAAGLPHHPVPLSRRGSRPFQELRSVLALTRLYRRLQPDLVHHVTSKPVLYGSLAARLARVPAVVNAVSGLGYVFIARGRAAAVRRRLVIAGYRLAFSDPNAWAIFQNEDDRGAFVGARVLPLARTVLIRGSGVDLAAFAPTPEPPGAPVVVLPARMLWDKGVGEFVQAARAVKAAGIPARFVLVGDSDPGNPAAVEPAQLTRWDEDGDIEWRGYRSDMAAVLAGAHVVCLPSYREGLPKALLEAAAAGRPIVTTDVPGCREVVRDGENGFLVPARDAAALADRLRALLIDADRRAAMGLRGRAIAEAEFGVARVVDATLELYRRLLDRAGPASAGAGTDRARGTGTSCAGPERLPER